MSTTETQKAVNGLNNTDSRRTSLLKTRRGTLFARKSISLNRPSVWNINVDRKILPQVQYENTYRMESNDDEQFSSHKAKLILEEELKRLLHDVKYDPESAANMTRIISEKLKMKLKELPYFRYKFVILVVLSSRSSGGACCASRALWSEKEGDNFAEAIFSNESLFAIATVYGLYFE